MQAGVTSAGVRHHRAISRCVSVPFRTGRARTLTRRGLPRTSGCAKHGHYAIRRRCHGRARCLFRCEQLRLGNACSVMSRGRHERRPRVAASVAAGFSRWRSATFSRSPAQLRESLRPHGGSTPFRSVRRMPVTFVHDPPRSEPREFRSSHSRLCWTWRNDVTCVFFPALWSHAIRCGCARTGQGHVSRNARDGMDRGRRGAASRIGYWRLSRDSRSTPTYGIRLAARKWGLRPLHVANAASLRDKRDIHGLSSASLWPTPGRPQKRIAALF